MSRGGPSREVEDVANGAPAGVRYEGTLGAADGRPAGAVGRRRFLIGLTAAVPAALLGGAPWRAALEDRGARAVRPGGVSERPPGARLRTRPHAPARPADPGRHELPEAAGTGAALYVPSAAAGRAASLPLVVFLHGAMRTLPPLDRLADEADARGIALAVPMARQHTWDLMAEGAYGADVAALDAAFEAAFDRVRIDPGRVCLAGFSDGASYALSVGLQNGDLVTHIVAHSPGFVGPGEALGSPRVFISHGTRDRILPLRATTARILHQLRGRGLDATYRQFDGGHRVPPEIAGAALDWVARKADG